jgi:hypothetical protein
VPEPPDQTDYDTGGDRTRPGAHAGLQEAAPAEFLSAGADELGDEKCCDRRSDGGQARDGNGDPGCGAKRDGQQQQNAGSSHGYTGPQDAAAGEGSRHELDAPPGRPPEEQDRHDGSEPRRELDDLDQDGIDPERAPGRPGTLQRPGT